MYSNYNKTNQSSRGGFNAASSRPLTSAPSSSRGRGSRGVATTEFGEHDVNGPSSGGNHSGAREPQSFQQSRQDASGQQRREQSGFNSQGSSLQKAATDFEQREIPAFELPENGEFTSFPEISQQTVDRLTEHKIPSLFPIQRDCFHPIYHGVNVIGRELTGCGKTLAFALPLVEQLRASGTLGSGKTQAIVMAPTRELAIQVEKTFEMLKFHYNEFQTLTVYGGVSVDDQTRKLKQGVDIFVGTTGRTLDHLGRGNIDFSNLKAVVLDEADMMLDMGFKEDIDQILGHISYVMSKKNKQLQICLFSATVPDWVKKVAREYMNGDFKMVDLAQDLHNKTAKNVRHIAIHVANPRDQLKALNAVLTAATGGSSLLPKALVFTQTKLEADRLFEAGGGTQGGIGVMHGDITQTQREQAINGFKRNQLRVLVATDVASRGLDIPNVDLVVQYQPPKNAETYIHRSGRTARAGASGTCVTFYNKYQLPLIESIVQQSGINLEAVDDLSTLDISCSTRIVEETTTPSAAPSKPQNNNPRSSKPTTAASSSRPAPSQRQQVERPERNQHEQVATTAPKRQAPRQPTTVVQTDHSVNAEKLLGLNRMSSKKLVCSLLSFIEQNHVSVDDAVVFCEKASFALQNDVDSSVVVAKKKVHNINLNKSMSSDEDKENEPVVNNRSPTPTTTTTIEQTKHFNKDEDSADSFEEAQLNSKQLPLQQIDPEQEEREGLELVGHKMTIKTKPNLNACETVKSWPLQVTLEAEDLLADTMEYEEPENIVLSNDLEVIDDLVFENSELLQVD